MKNSACFIGDKKIKFTELWKKADAAVYELIKNGVTRFIFGESSEFGNLCLYIAGIYKEKNPEIERIKFKINPDETENYILGISGKYDKKILFRFTDGSEQSEEIKRYIAMVYESEYCVFYYGDKPSGEILAAYKYALDKNKKIVNLK